MSAPNGGCVEKSGGIEDRSMLLAWGVWAPTSVIVPTSANAVKAFGPEVIMRH